jgi:hypothetical protein
MTGPAALPEGAGVVLVGIRPGRYAIDVLVEDTTP